MFFHIGLLTVNITRCRTVIVGLGTVNKKVTAVIIGLRTVNTIGRTAPTVKFHTAAHTLVVFFTTV